MTIDETIEREKERSEMEYRSSSAYSDCDSGMSREYSYHIFQAQYHEQLAEWLEELKAIRKWKSDIISEFAKYDATCADEIYQKGRHYAIDELKGKKEEIIRWLIKRDKEGYGTTNGELLDHILGIAEEMKEGAEC